MDVTLVSRNAPALGSADHFPQAQSPVAAAGGDHAAVTRHGHTFNSLAVSGEGAYLLARSHVPELYFAAVVWPTRLAADRYKPRTIRRKNHHECRATQGFQTMNQLSAGRVPEANVVVTA